MTDPSPGTGPGTDHGATESTPRWVKAFGSIALILVFAFVVLQFVVGGGHGPGRHVPSGEGGGGTPPTSVTQDHTPPMEHGEQQPRP